jgi:hypothetical protein
LTNNQFKTYIQLNISIIFIMNRILVLTLLLVSLLGMHLHRFQHFEEVAATPAAEGEAATENSTAADEPAKVDAPA